MLNSIMMKSMMKAIVMTDQQIIQESQMALIQLKQIQNHANWSLFSQKPCKMYKMHNGNRLLSKGQLTMNLPMKQILHRLADQQIMKHLNPQLKQISVLHKAEAKGKHARVNYMRYQGIWPVQDRDFVNVSVMHQGENVSYIASKQSKYPHPKVDKVTRAVCYIAGYILYKVDEENTRLVYISDVDVCGSIPQMLKNKLSERQAAMPSQIQKVLTGKYNPNEQVQQDQLDLEGEDVQ